MDLITAVKIKLEQEMDIPIIAGRAADPTVTAPYACLYLISTPSDPLTGLTWPRIQVSIWAQDYPTAQEVADQIVAILHNFKGKLGLGTTYTIQNITLLDRSDIFDSGCRMIGSQLDFQIIYI